MPICPKCGKSLSSEQALSYHLNKKYKCGSWKCISCKQVFDTKLQLNLHELNCCAQSFPDYDFLRKVYMNFPGNIIQVDNGFVKNESNGKNVGKYVHDLTFCNVVFRDDSCIIENI